VEYENSLIFGIPQRFISGRRGPHAAGISPQVQPSSAHPRLSQMTLPQPLRLVAFEYRGRTGSGQTRPLRCVARNAAGDALQIVLKVREPGATGGHHGGTSLACELIMAVLARALGLSVPDFAIVEVGPIFAGGISDPAASALLLANCGPNFATKLMTRGIRGWDPDCRSTSATLRHALDGVLSFDATVINGDRKRPNPNLLWDGADTVAMIDHGLACPVHDWPDADIAASPVMPDGLVQAHAGYAFLKGAGCQFNHVSGNWSATMTDARWDELRAMIPSNWEERPGDLDRIFRFLKERPGKFLEVGTSLRRVLQ
jgi:hypothetical protein